MFYIISKDNGKMLQYDGEIRYKIKNNLSKKPTMLPFPSYIKKDKI